MELLAPCYLLMPLTRMRGPITHGKISTGRRISVPQFTWDRSRAATKLYRATHGEARCYPARAATRSYLVLKWRRAAYAPPPKRQKCRAACFVLYLTTLTLPKPTMHGGEGA